MGLSFPEILILLSLGFSLAVPLGPVTMEMIKQTLSQKIGWIYGIITGLGAISGDFFISMTILFVGNRQLENLLDNTIIYVVLVLFNIFILLYIGTSALKIKVEINPSDYHFNQSNWTRNNIRKSLKQYFTGLVIVLSSPWSYFWWISFGPIILKSGIPLVSFYQRFVVTLVFISGIFLWILILCGGVAISRKFAQPKTLERLTIGSGYIILVFAALIIYEDLFCYLVDFWICIDFPI